MVQKGVGGHVGDVPILIDEGERRSGRGRGGQGRGSRGRSGRGRRRDVINGGRQVLDAEGRGDAYPPDLVDKKRGRGEDGGSGRGRTDSEAVSVDTAGGRGGRGRGCSGCGRGVWGRIGCGRGRGRGRGPRRGWERGEIDPPDLVEEECGCGEDIGASGHEMIGRGRGHENERGSGREGRGNDLPPNPPDLTALLAEETHQRNRVRAYASPNAGIPSVSITTI